MSSKKFWQELFKIGQLSYPRFMAAPMDGLTDSPFRQLIRTFSPNELLFTEMRHVACVANEKDARSLRYNPIEQPLEFQISANSIDFVPEAIEKILARSFPSINLNAGCPARLVIKSGSGSALMAKPELLENIMRLCVKTINNRVPFTLKIRAGFKEKNAFTIAQLAQDCGIDALIIHPRTQLEGFVGKLDYDLVKTIKETVKIPVIFSGNIIRFDHAQKVYEQTGVDGFMIGRALWGAPWKLKELSDASQNITFTPSHNLALDCARKHIALNTVHYGAHGFVHVKKQLAQYIKSIPNAAQWRLYLLRSQTEQEMLEHITTIEKTLMAGTGEPE